MELEPRLHIGFQAHDQLVFVTVQVMLQNLHSFVPIGQYFKIELTAFCSEHRCFKDS